MNELRPASHRARPAVLVVDDNQANLIALEALLGVLDLDITRAASGEEALRAILTRDFEVVLMDVQMPGLDGFQTTELIRQRDRSRHLPIIFLTAIFTDGESRRRAYRLGALDFVTKPFDEEMLRAKVAAVVAQYRHADVIERQAEALRDTRTRLEEANRAKDEFLATVSHELRSPLNALLGWSALLENEPALPPRAQTAAQAIARNARAQSRIIDELLDLSLLSARQLQLESAPVDLARVAQSVLAAMQPAAGARRVQLSLASDGASHWTQGDGRRIEQLITHLVSNAIKFSNEAASVRVELVRVGDRLRVAVKDTGVGIAPEQLPHIFERFRQADGSRTRRHGGLGIGLTLAQLIAVEHGGTLEAFSAGTDKGATFVLTLPALAEPATVPPAGVEAAAHGAEGALAGVRVLVVDDEADVRFLLATVLTDAGALVVEAASAAEALRQLDGQPFDALVSDLGMPEENGADLLREIRAREAQRGGRVAALALSGYGSRDDREQTHDAGFGAHLVKPCEPATVVATLAQLVASARRAGG